MSPFVPTSPPQKYQGELVRFPPHLPPFPATLKPTKVWHYRLHSLVWGLLRMKGGQMGGVTWADTNCMDREGSDRCLSFPSAVAFSRIWVRSQEGLTLLRVWSNQEMLTALGECLGFSFFTPPFVLKFLHFLLTSLESSTITKIRSFCVVWKHKVCSWV